MNAHLRESNHLAGVALAVNHVCLPLQHLERAVYHRRHGELPYPAGAVNIFARSISRIRVLVHGHFGLDLKFLSHSLVVIDDAATSGGIGDGARMSSLRCPLKSYPLFDTFLAQLEKKFLSSSGERPKPINVGMIVYKSAPGGIGSHCSAVVTVQRLPTVVSSLINGACASHLFNTLPAHLSREVRNRTTYLPIAKHASRSLSSVL